MYLAELHGKLPSSVEGKEDILTSNVFSFFKYADRNIYLKGLMNLLKINVFDKDLLTAEFSFWPNYHDNTQPDVVLIVGPYYILWEAKYFAGFGEEEIKSKSQIIREINGGLNEAKNLDKKFIYAAITADYVYCANKFSIIGREYKEYFKWLNWQSISYLLLNLLEHKDSELPDYLFANDLYQLLDKKKLRSFQSFNRLRDIYKFKNYAKIFFSSENANFRGKFLGFSKILLDLQIKKPNKVLFFENVYNNHRDYFKIAIFNIYEPMQSIFYKGGNK